nr:MAG TPA: hypothetical protein [Microviridae sp.]
MCQLCYIYQVSQCWMFHPVHKLDDENHRRI